MAVTVVKSAVIVAIGVWLLFSGFNDPAEYDFCDCDYEGYEACAIDLVGLEELYELCEPSEAPWGLALLGGVVLAFWLHRVIKFGREMSRVGRDHPPHCLSCGSQ